MENEIVENKIEEEKISNEIRTRIYGGKDEHRHDGYDYWHPASRVHSSVDKSLLPAGHVLERKPLAEKLIYVKKEVTPIQMMDIGSNLEIGAVQSLFEGLACHRRVGSIPIQMGRNTETLCLNECSYGLFYAEWKPNNSSAVHRYLIEILGSSVYVGYWPWDGRRPILYGVYHGKEEVVKFLHKTYDKDLKVPGLIALKELNIPNVRFSMGDASRNVHISQETLLDKQNYPPNATYITHKQGSFYTRSLYGEFVRLSDGADFGVLDQMCPDVLEYGHIYTNEKFGYVSIMGRSYGVISDEDGNVMKVYGTDDSGYSMSDPEHPWYMFQGAIGYVELYEGKMFCYPDGSIRFLNKDDEGKIFRKYTDLKVVQGDLVVYKVPTIPFVELEGGFGKVLPDGETFEYTSECRLDRHHIQVEASMPCGTPKKVLAVVGDYVYVRDDCTIVLTHPEHPEVKYNAKRLDVLALLPGTSRPFMKDGGVD